MIDLDVRLDTVLWEAPLSQYNQGVPSRHHSRAIDTSSGEIANSTDFLNNLNLPGGVQAKIKHRGPEAVMVFSGSLPRVLHGHNVHPVTIEDSLLAMLIVEQSVHGIALTPFTPHRRVARVDLVRDFWPVPTAASMVSSIANDPTYRRTGTDHYTTSRGSGACTIYRGPAQARSVLYSKEGAVAASRRHLNAQSRAEATREAQDRVRYELRLTQGELRGVIGASLLDVDEEIVLGAMHRRFAEAHFDRSGHGVSEFLAALARSDLSTARKVSLAGASMFEAHAIDIGMGRGTSSRNRTDMKNLGLVLDRLEHLILPARLDFGSGEAVDVSNKSSSPSKDYFDRLLRDVGESHQERMACKSRRRPARPQPAIDSAPASPVALA